MVPLAVFSFSPHPAPQSPEGSGLLLLVRAFRAERKQPPMPPWTAAWGGIALTVYAPEPNPIQYLGSRARIVGIIQKKVAVAAAPWPRGLAFSAVLNAARYVPFGRLRLRAGPRRHKEPERGC